MAGHKIDGKGKGVEMSGELLISAPRERVWAALNDPEVLRKCIPGCRSLDMEGETGMRATVEIKIGPIGAKFDGVVALSDIRAPEAYTISGQGQGGAVGSAKGGARIRLVETDGGTTLIYEVSAQVGGRLAQLGGPIIDATARQLAAKFFREFGATVQVPERKLASAAPTVADVALTSPVVGPPSSKGEASSDARVATWLVALLAAALVGYQVGRASADAVTSEWMGLSIGLLVIAIGAAAHAMGQRTVAPVIMIDPRLLQVLTEMSKK